MPPIRSARQIHQPLAVIKKRIIMKTAHLICIIFLLTGIKGYAQTELKLYTTGFERLGAGIEYFTNEHIGFELGSSYWQKKTNYNLINADIEQKEVNFYVNAMIKRYSAPKLNNAGIFYGGYIRYWMEAQSIINDDNWTIEQKDYYISNNRRRTLRTHKISLGGIMGYKTQFSSKLSLGFTFGLGSSIPSSYWKKVTYYDYSVKTSPVNNTLFGNLALISVIGQISINYRFGKI